MFKENIVIWSNKNFSKYDDLDEIKHELYKKGKEVDIVSYKLLTYMEDIRVYRVNYDYKDQGLSKTKVK